LFDPETIRNKNYDETRQRAEAIVERLASLWSLPFRFVAIGLITRWVDNYPVMGDFLVKNKVDLLNLELLILLPMAR